MGKRLSAPQVLLSGRKLFFLYEDWSDFSVTSVLAIFTLFGYTWKKYNCYRLYVVCPFWLSAEKLVSSYLCCVFPLQCTCLLCKLIHLEQEFLLLEPVRDQKHRCQSSSELVSVSYRQQDFLSESNFKNLKRLSTCIFFTVQADQQSSILWHDTKGLCTKSYTVSYVFRNIFWIFWFSETSLTSNFFLIYLGEIEVCLSSFTEHLLQSKEEAIKCFYLIYCSWIQFTVTY